MEQTDFGSLIGRCYPRIRRAALLITGNAADADDLAQETFLQAMQSWRRFDQQSRVETWLYSILINLDRKRRRGYVRRWRRLRRWLDGRSSNQRAAPSAEIELQEWRESLWSAVGDLPDTMRQAIVLRYAEGLSYDEVATVMQCPIGTVKSRVHNGLAAFKRKLVVHGGIEL